MVLIQQITNGLVQGSIYVMVALGLTLIYGVLVQINFAHGEFLMLGTFAGYLAVTAGSMPYLLSIVIATVVGGALGAAIEFGIFRPLRRRGADALRPLAATVGVAIVLQNLVLLWLGPVPRQYPSPYDDSVLRVGALYLTYQRVLIVAVAATAVGALYIFLRRTSLGRAIRAVSEDPQAASLVGINVGMVILTTFVIGSGLAGMGGALLGPILVVDPFLGAKLIVIAFAIVILGGFGNVNGTILAGLIVGVIDSLVTGYIDPGLSTIVIFAVLLLTLAIRPTGLIAERVEENV